MQVASTRWIIGLNARQDAAISLSAVNLPGDVQVASSNENPISHIANAPKPHSSLEKAVSSDPVSRDSICAVIKHSGI